MAPKEKGKSTKEKEAAKETVGPSMDEILRSRFCMAFAALITLLLVLGAMGTISLFFAEEKKHEDDRRGLELLRDFVIGNNESLKDKSDEFMMNAAYGYMKELTIVRDKSLELKTITENLKKEKDWYSVGTKRFTFTETEMSFYDARKFCSKNNSTLAVIISEEVEVYLENQARERAKTFWIGLSTNTTSTKFFWVTGQEAFTTQATCKIKVKGGYSITQWSSIKFASGRSQPQSVVTAPNIVGDNSAQRTTASQHGQDADQGSDTGHNPNLHWNKKAS